MKYHFKGRLSYNSQEDSVPSELKLFLSHLLEDHNVSVQDSPTSNGHFSQAVNTIAQLILFNFHTRSRIQTEAPKRIRHPYVWETPLSIYIGLATYSKTGSKQLIKIYNHLGLSQCYERIVQLANQYGNAVVDNFFVDKAPSNSFHSKNVFTTCAVDNIDHNPTSTTACYSFHGTAITITQHPDVDNDGICLQDTSSVLVSPNAVKKTSRMVHYCSSYRNIFKCVGEVLSDMTETIFTCHSLCSGDGYTRIGLLKHVKKCIDFPAENTHSDISWPSFHAKQMRSTNLKPCLTGLLPLLPNNISTIKHCMDIVKRATSILHPGQIPVIVLDQPLYALCK